MQKAKEKRQLGREVINFGPQTIGQTLASSTRSCFPNTIYSLITFSSFVPFSSYICRAYLWANRIFLWPQIYFFREEPFGDLSPMEAGMKVGLSLTMNNPYKMTDHSFKKIKLETKFRQIATEGLRLSISPGISPHMAKLIKICMNEVIIINLMTIMTKPMVIWSQSCWRSDGWRLILVVMTLLTINVISAQFLRWL